MAKQVNKLKKFRESTLGHVVEAVIYSALLLLVCIYFAGNGSFIYEGF